MNEDDPPGVVVPEVGPPAVEVDPFELPERRGPVARARSSGRPEARVVVRGGFRRAPSFLSPEDVRFEAFFVDRRVCFGPPFCFWEGLTGG